MTPITQIWEFPHPRHTHTHAPHRCTRLREIWKHCKSNSKPIIISEPSTDARRDECECEVTNLNMTLKYQISRRHVFFLKKKTNKKTLRCFFKHFSFALVFSVSPEPKGLGTICVLSRWVTAHGLQVRSEHLGFRRSFITCRRLLSLVSP